MSLKSTGVSITISSPNNTKIGYGHVANCTEDAAANALRLAIEDYIKSDDFKVLTTKSCYANHQLTFSFLVHTSL